MLNINSGQVDKRLPQIGVAWGQWRSAMDAVVEGARVRTAKGHGTVLARRGMLVRVGHDGGGVSWVQLSECQVVPPNCDSPHTQSDGTPQAATTTAASSQVGSLCALQLIAPSLRF